jgi:integrase
MTMPGYHAGRPPRNKGRLYPADPPTVEEIVAVMRAASDDPHGYRLRALIVLLWRGGLRVAEALALGERDLDTRRGSLLVRNGKGGRRREIGMDAWGWLESGGGGHHRRAPGVDGGDDLFGVDALQVDRLRSHPQLVRTGRVALRNGDARIQSSKRIRRLLDEAVSALPAR